METLAEKRRSIISRRSFPLMYLRKSKKLVQNQIWISLIQTLTELIEWTRCVLTIKKVNYQRITWFIILLSVIEYCCIGPKKSNKKELDLTKRGIHLLRSHELTKTWTPSPLVYTCSILVTRPPFLLRTFKTLHQIIS